MPLSHLLLTVGQSPEAAAAVAGTGSLTAPASSLSGAAAVTVVGDGELTVAPATVDGAGSLSVTGFGALTAAAATIAGSADVGPAVVTGTGELVGPVSIMAAAVSTPAVGSLNGLILTAARTYLNALQARPRNAAAIVAARAELIRLRGLR